MILVLQSSLIFFGMAVAMATACYGAISLFFALVESRMATEDSALLRNFPSRPVKQASAPHFAANYNLKLYREQAERRRQLAASLQQARSPSQIIASVETGHKTELHSE